MRPSRVLVTVAALGILGVAGCGGDAADDRSAAPGPSGAASGATASPGAGTPGATPGASVPGGNGGPDPTEAGSTPGQGAPDQGSPDQGSPGRQSGRPDPTKPGGGTGIAAARLAASGLGPYQQGTTQQKLSANAQLVKVTVNENCPGFTIAEGVRTYSKPTLVFFEEKLQYLTVTSKAVATLPGARVGMKAAEVKRLHPTGKELTDWSGAPAWFSTVGNNGLLFHFTAGKVSSIEAGLAAPIQFRYTDGEGGALCGAPPS